MSYSAVFFGSRYRKLLFASLLTVRIRAGVVVTVTFQQVDDTPHAETGTEGDNEGLENGDCLIEKFHK